MDQSPDTELCARIPEQALLPNYSSWWLCGRVKSALHSYGIKSPPLNSYALPVTAVTAWEPAANLDQLYIPCRAITWALSQQYLQNYGLLFRKWVFYANADLLTSARYRPIEKDLLKLQFHMG